MDHYHEPDKQSSSSSATMSKAVRCRRSAVIIEFKPFRVLTSGTSNLRRREKDSNSDTAILSPLFVWPTHKSLNVVFAGLISVADMASKFQSLLLPLDRDRTKWLRSSERHIQLKASGQWRCPNSIAPEKFQAPLDLSVVK